MGNGLNLSLVQLQGGLDQGFTVSGRAGAGDVRVLWHFFVNFLHGADGGGQGAAVVVAVKGVQELAVLIHESHLCGRASGIDAEIAVAVAVRKLCGFHAMSAVALQKFVKFLPGCKQRLHARHLKFHVKLAGEPLKQRVQRRGTLLLVI